MAEEQDKTHRLLFHFPRMIKDLIRLCLGGEWVERLDFETLERVPERLLSRELVRREQDVLWRLRYLPEGKGEQGGRDPASRPRIYLDGKDIEYLDREDEYFNVPPEGGKRNIASTSSTSRVPACGWRSTWLPTSCSPSRI